MAVTDIGLSVPTIRGADMVLSNLGTHYSRNGNLSTSESVMAVSLASANVNDSRYGGTLHNFQLTRPELPEVVQGVLANYSGV